MSNPPFPLLPDDSLQRSSAVSPTFVMAVCLLLLLGGLFFGVLFTFNTEDSHPSNNFIGGASIFLLVRFIAALVWSVFAAIIPGREGS
jgi:hypothetical protein